MQGVDASKRARTCCQSIFTSPAIFLQALLVISMTWSNHPILREHVQSRINANKRFSTNPDDVKDSLTGTSTLCEFLHLTKPLLVLE